LLFQFIVGPSLFRRLGSVYGLRILDLACGQGFLCRELARRGAQVTGVDASGEMIRLARTYESGNPLGITYLHADAADLRDLDDGSFDIVICNLSLTDIADLEGAMT
ncbi:MAG: class I SAM-dependent methyltransferase, partial [Chloroflexota bacterium]